MEKAKKLTFVCVDAMGWAAVAWANGPAGPRARGWLAGLPRRRSWFALAWSFLLRRRRKRRNCQDAEDSLGHVSGREPGRVPGALALLRGVLLQSALAFLCMPSFIHFYILQSALAFLPKEHCGLLKHTAAFCKICKEYWSKLKHTEEHWSILQDV